VRARAKLLAGAHHRSGGGNEAAPFPHASHISSQLASKATDRPASTRSSRPTFQSRASASTKAAADRWLTATPFGAPVEPEVKITQASSSSRIDRVCPPGRLTDSIAHASRMTAQAADRSRISSARAGGSSVSTGT